MYHHLKLKNINLLDQNVNQKKIIKGLSDCYSKYAFSTFPYIIDQISSKDAIKKYNSGNCIALSLSLKDYFEKIGIKSYLIPATIPKKYSRPGYLEISHVALLIPKSNNSYYVADPAFYFLNPLKSDSKLNITYSKDIYKDETENNPSNYKSIDKLSSINLKLEKDKVYNKYQTIPKGTMYLETESKNDSSDKWRYYAIEILNPDKSISNFFVNILNRPFIVTTILDENGICCRDINLKFISDKSISINYKNKYKVIDLEKPKEIVEKELYVLNKKIGKFFDNNLINILLNYKIKEYFIND